MSVTTEPSNELDNPFLDEWVISDDFHSIFKADDGSSKRESTTNSLFGLPEKVKVILKEERGIEKLYGNFAIDPNAMLLLTNRIYEITVIM